MSFRERVRNGESKIDRKAADLVRDGVSPWEAYRMAAEIVDRTPRRVESVSQQSVSKLSGG